MLGGFDILHVHELIDPVIPFHFLGQGFDLITGMDNMNMGIGQLLWHPFFEVLFPESSIDVTVGVERMKANLGTRVK